MFLKLISIPRSPSFGLSHVSRKVYGWGLLLESGERGLLLAFTLTQAFVSWRRRLEAPAIYLMRGPKGDIQDLEWALQHGQWWEWLQLLTGGGCLGPCCCVCGSEVVPWGGMGTLEGWGPAQNITWSWQENLPVLEHLGWPRRCLQLEISSRAALGKSFSRQQAPRTERTNTGKGVLSSLGSHQLLPLSAAPVIPCA